MGAVPRSHEGDCQGSEVGITAESIQKSKTKKER